MSPPDFGGLRSGRPECPSDFTLDRLHAGELARAEAQEAERHVATCADCGARMAERRAGFDGLDGVDPRAMLGRIRTGLDAPAPLPTRLLAGARRLFAPLAVVATAAIAFVVFHPGEEPLGTRMKGSLGLHVFRLAGERAEEVVSGGTFAPGDRLRFTVDLPVEGDVRVLGVESSGALYTAWPLEPGVRTRLGPGTGIELSGAVSLDAQPGRETLHLVQCPVDTGAPHCTSGGASAAPVCPAGCVMTPFLLDKRLP
jgi:hypothetical protein